MGVFSGQEGPNLPRPPLFQYQSWGVAVADIRLDVLTGEVDVLRADVLLDCGKSLNPAVDIGQMEGAFVEGIGNMLTEEYVYDGDSGRLLSDGTWEYKV